MARDSRGLAAGAGTLTRHPFRGNSSGRSDVFRQLPAGVLLIALTVAIHGSVLGWSGGFFFATVSRMYPAPGSGPAPRG